MVWATEDKFCLMEKLSKDLFWPKRFLIVDMGFTATEA